MSHQHSQWLSSKYKTSISPEYLQNSILFAHIGQKYVIKHTKPRAVVLSGGRNRGRRQQEYFQDWTSVSHHGKLKSQHPLVTFRRSQWESRRLSALKHPQSCSFTPPDQNTLTLLALTDSSLFSSARCKWLGDCWSGREISGVPFVWCFLFSREGRQNRRWLLSGAALHLLLVCFPDFITSTLKGSSESVILTADISCTSYWYWFWLTLVVTSISTLYFTVSSSCVPPHLSVLLCLSRSAFLFSWL